jgi:hypothetical protein
MVNVPAGIKTNSIPKALVNVFSTLKTGAEKERMIVIKTKKKKILETFFNIIDFFRIATSG